jgi:hypothetical protein
MREHRTCGLNEGGTEQCDEVRLSRASPDRFFVPQIWDAVLLQDDPALLPLVIVALPVEAPSALMACAIDDFLMEAKRLTLSPLNVRASFAPA